MRLHINLNTEGLMIRSTLLTIVKIKLTSSMDDFILNDHVTVMCPKSVVDVLRYKRSWDRDQLYLECCGSAQTFWTLRHKLKLPTSCRRFYRIVGRPRLGFSLQRTTRKIKHHCYKTLVLRLKIRNI